MAAQKCAEIERIVDSLLAKEAIIRIGTKNGSKSVEGESRKNLFIVHPSEGHVRDLETVAGLIDMNVYGLQCTKETPLESFEKMAAFYIEKIMSVQPTGPYFIGGYSLGVSIGMEIVLQMEREEGAGQVAKFVCFDCSPEYVHHLLKLSFGITDFYKTPIAKVQEEILSMFLLNFPRDWLVVDYRDKVGLSKSFNGKLQRVLDLVDPTDELSPALQENLKLAAISFYRSRVMAFSYQPRGEVKAQVILMKSDGVRDHKLGDDYGLQKYCQQQIEVEMVTGDHFSYIQKEAASQVAGHINKFLSL